MKDLYVSWDEYNRLIEKLALKVWESGWTFDAILCLARGGLRVGDVMSRLFDKPLGVLFTSSYRENAGTTQSRLLIADHISSAAGRRSG
jgi:hypoxanthine phosphoribosyltransferase